MKLRLDNKLTLCPYIVQKDQKHYIVEHVQSGEFYEMPQICVDALHKIEQGMSLGEIEQELIHIYPDEEVDILNFAAQLLDLQFVQEIDGQSVVRAEARNTAGGKSRSTKKDAPVQDGLSISMNWVPERMGRFFFNSVTTKIFLLIFVVNIILFITHPGLIPHYQDVFIFESMMLNILTWLVLSLMVVLHHECGHVLAVRAQSMPTRIGIGHRLFLVVFETDMSQVWRLPARKRNVLYVAGMGFDQWLLCIALLIQLLFPQTHWLLLGIVGFVVFDIFIKTIYQCCVYMKTDLYYLLENITGCYNLVENGKSWLSRWLPFIKKEETTLIFEAEERIIRIYAIFYMIGIAVTMAIFTIYLLPQMISVYYRTLPQLMQPISNPYFWDALAFVSQSLLMIGLLLYSWKKNTASS